MDPNSGSTSSSNCKSQAPQEPSVCAHVECGFFGSAKNKGFCSQHYNAYLKEKMAEAEVHANKKKEEALKVAMEKVSELISSLSLNKDQDPQVKKSNRCESCKKKIGLLGFSCRCGGNYCGMHRYPEKHCCTFDFKTVGKSKIEKENPLVQASKLHDRP